MADELPRGQPGFTSNAQISAALMVGGLAGIAATSSVACCENSSSADDGPNDSDSSSQPKSDRVIATSGAYHREGGKVGDMIQTAQAAVESIQKSVGALEESKSGGVKSLRAASETRGIKKKSFKVLAAQLDAKNEREKVQLARLLRELHALAKSSEEQAKSKSKSTRSSSTGGEEEVGKEVSPPVVTPVSGADSQSREGRPNFGSGTMQLQLDPRNLTPERATQYIEALRNGSSFDVESLSALFRSSTKLLLNDPSLIDLRDRERVTVVGDLHGSLPCLTNVLYEIGDIRPENAVVFNGDFVDRGPQSLEVILTLLILKLAYPDRVYLNRGNHEDSFLSTVYGFEDELRKKYGDDNLEYLWGELSNIFSALPIVCLTHEAAIMHGGLPSEDFSLDEIRSISPEERYEARSVLEPQNGTERLLQNVLWSDPDDSPGIRPNESRGAGNAFGPDVARSFLDRHGLKYLIRSHEPWEEGWTAMDCGNDRYVVTVFSTAVYDGCDSGAVVNLHRDGRILPALVPQLSEPEKEGKEDEVVEKLVGMIASNKAKLSEAFESIAPRDGAKGGAELTREQWAGVMSEVLDLPEVDWMGIQSMLAPTTAVEEADHSEMHDTGMINWTRFLDLHSLAISSTGDDGGVHDASAVETLYANHAMLLTVFKFLDTDGNGRVDRDEFRTGIELLNKRLPGDQTLREPDKLFDIVDLDGSGEIELDEFSEVFKVL